jgi:hypothetical protein
MPTNQKKKYYDAAWIGWQVAAVSRACRDDSSFILWRMPLALAGHLVAQGLGYDGVKVERPMDAGEIKNIFQELGIAK